MHRREDNVIYFPSKFIDIFDGDDAMALIKCRECKGKAIIQSRAELDVVMSKLYCTCKDCGHRFVMDLSFSHTITPGASQVQTMIMNLLQSLPANQREAILTNAHQMPLNLAVR